MSLIDDATVIKMAELSRLRLSDDEVTNFSHDLGAILNYVAKLPDTHTHVSQEATLRMDKDEARPHDDKLLNNAVALENNAVKVKAILDRGDA